MGSGKTTLGRALHAATGLPFTDLDEAIEERAGMSVREIFDRFGEAEFRRMEREMLAETARGGDMIIACGGGTPCQDGNMELMDRLGITIWLEAPTERLAERLEAAMEQRPLIAGKSRDELRRFIEETTESRRKHYSKARERFDSSRLDNAAEIEETTGKFIERFMPERR